MTMLLPCPFCGAPAEYDNCHVHGKQRWFVGCSANCNVSEGHDSEDTMATAWNTRALPQAGADAWRPIETTPKDGTLILAGRFVEKCIWNMNGHIVVDFWHTKHYVGLGMFNEQWPATHWQPLPAPPRAHQAAKEAIDHE